METKQVVSIFSRAINKTVDVFLTAGGGTITGKLLQYTIDGICIQKSDPLLKDVVLIPKASIKIVVIEKSTDDK